MQGSGGRGQAQSSGFKRVFREDGDEVRSCHSRPQVLAEGAQHFLCDAGRKSPTTAMQIQSETDF